MKIRIEERNYEGTGTEIMDQLRMAAFDPTEYPDTEIVHNPSYEMLFAEETKPELVSTILPGLSGR